MHLILPKLLLLYFFFFAVYIYIYIVPVAKTVAPAPTSVVPDYFPWLSLRLKCWTSAQVLRHYSSLRTPDVGDPFITIFVFLGTSLLRVFEGYFSEKCKNLRSACTPMRLENSRSMPTYKPILFLSTINHRPMQVGWCQTPMIKSRQPAHVSLVN